MIISKYKNLIGLIGLLILACLVPLVMDNPYYIHLLILAGINAMLAMTFVLMLRTGLISIAIAAFWGIGAYASAVLSVKFNIIFWFALPIATIITAIVAIVLGFFFVRNAGFSFVIMSLVLAEVLVLAFGNTPFLGGYQGIMGIPGAGEYVFK